MCAAIEADGRDVKALFRRSQALQQLGRLDQAVRDLQRCVSLEPRNKAFQEALRALGSSMHDKVGRGALGVPARCGCGQQEKLGRTEPLFLLCCR